MAHPDDSEWALPCAQSRTPQQLGSNGRLGCDFSLLTHPALMLHTTDLFGNSKADEVIERDAFVMGEIRCLLTNGSAEAKRERQDALVFHR